MVAFVGLNDNPTYIEHGASAVLDDDAIISGASAYNGATLTLARSGGANPEDVFDGTGTLSLSDIDVIVDGVAVGSFTNNGGTLAITFNGNATATLVNRVLEQLTYANGSASPPGSVTIDFNFSDGSASPAFGSITVAITATSDTPPVLTSVESNALYQPGTGGALLSPQLSVADDTSSTLASAEVRITDPAAGDVLFVGTFTSGFGGITWNYSGGVLSFNGTGSLNDYQQLLDAVYYQSTVADPTAAGADPTRTIQWTANDGSGPNALSEVRTTTLHFVLPPVITSDGGGDSATIGKPENFTGPITQVHATDSDPGATITYAIFGGDDAGRFQIDSATGVLTFVAPPDFEVPADADRNNAYLVQVGAIATSSATPDPLTDVQTITVNVANVNEAPVIVSNGGGDTGAVSVAENATAVTTVTAPDPDNNAVAYTIIGGVDAGQFQINSITGALSFAVAPNFENPADADHNNSYVVQVRAFDGSLADTQTLTVNVTNVNEPPVIVSNGGGDAAFVSVPENSTAVTTVSAFDPDAGAAPAYAIVGGSDADKFQINAATGALSFIAAPNFEHATDSDHNNSYVVQVRASDGNLADTQTLTVAVANVLDVDEIDAGAYTDFGGDGRTDVFLHNQDGTVAIWEMVGAQVKTAKVIGAVGTEWHVESTGDFTADGRGDVVWRSADGAVMTWQMNGAQIGNAQIIGRVGNEWQINGTGDLDGNGGADLVWRDNAGTLMLWQMNGVQIGAVRIFGAVGNEWHIVGIADFGGDNRDDILWRRDDGAVLLFQMNGTQIQSADIVGTVGREWHVIGQPDLDGDGKADILWRSDSGALTAWLMNGAQIRAAASIGGLGHEWHPAGTGDVGGDGKDDLFWRNDNGTVDVWQMNGGQILNAATITGLGLDWTLGVHHYDFV
jgi:Cadherin domain/FG-GAP-like repeat